MSNDTFDTFGGDDIFAEEEEEQQQPEGEGQNRTFIVAVAVLGGLLVFALISFGVWALVLNKPQQAVPPLTEIVATVTVEAMAAEADTPEPATDTPVPESTPTPLLGPTATPAPTDEKADAESMAAAPADTEAESADAEPTATQVPRRTPTPTKTPRSTSTPLPETGEAATDYGSSSSSQLSQTGLGEWLLVGGAILLVAVMVLARRLRST